MEDKREIPVVILCGGKGTRLNEETRRVPKPLVEIGGKPIIWHIMKIYSHQGFNKFVLLLGYKGEEIKNFFINYDLIKNDLNINLSSGSIKKVNKSEEENWDITLLDTGIESLTERRLFLAKSFLANYPKFMLTYGDGVADVNLNDLMALHEYRKDLLTVTGIRSPSKFGKIAHENGTIKSFTEKPLLDDLINGGFMIFNKESLNYLSEEDVMMENVIIPKLVDLGKVGIYHHKGFWHSMDTHRDKMNLEELWKKEAPWKIWRRTV
jgi:glucose-1-phosphate cytidylyltransferase